MTNHLKNALRFANKILQEEPTIWVEREIPTSKLVHPKFLKHRFATLNTFTEDIHRLYHNPYKIKSFLQVINSRLAVMSAFKQKYLPKRYVYPFLAVTLGLGGYFIYTKVKDIDDESHPLNPTNKATSGLKYVVSRFVLYNDRIINETAKLVNQICNRERIQYMTMHALSRLLDMKSIMNSTDKLTKEFVHNNVMNDEGIQDKLKQIIIRQLQDENRRADLHRLLLNFMKSEQARDLFVDALSNTMNSPEVRAQAVRTALGVVYGKLDDPDMKEGMRVKLQAFLQR